MPSRQTTTRSPPTAAELSAQLRLVVTRLARRLRQQADAPISPTQAAVLATVDRHGPLTLGDLADIERVRPPTITAAVGRLEQDGLVRRWRDSTDRRVSRVAMTSRGRHLLGRMRTRKTAYLDRRVQALGDDERAMLAQAVEVLRGMLDDD
jgi:DNA-binding MarR family transcriptional regulator